MEILNTILSIVLTSFMTYFVWYLQKYQTNKSLYNKAIMIIMKIMLKQQYNIHMKNKQITLDDLEDFSDMYEVYHAAGGNGTGTKMFEDIKKLEVI